MLVCIFAHSCVMCALRCVQQHSPWVCVIGLRGQAGWGSVLDEGWRISRICALCYVVVWDPWNTFKDCQKPLWIVVVVLAAVWIPDANWKLVALMAQEMACRGRTETSRDGQQSQRKIHWVPLVFRENAGVFSGHRVSAALLVNRFVYNVVWLLLPVIYCFSFFLCSLTLSCDFIWTVSCACEKSVNHLLYSI